MIKHLWSVLCRKAIVDSQTNNLTISEVFEQINVNTKIEKKNADSLKQINVPIEYEIVSLWFKEGEKSEHLKGDCQIEIMSPEAKLMKTLNQPLDMPAGMRRLRSMMRVMGLVVETSGDYTFRISVRIDGQKMYKSVAEIPLEIHLNKEIVEELPKN